MIGQTFEVRRHLINRANRTIDIVDDRGRLLSGTIVGTYATHIVANVVHDGTHMAIWFTELTTGPSQYRVPEVGEVFMCTRLEVFWAGLGTRWLSVIEDGGAIEFSLPAASV
jgi:hypothetical protein